MRVQTKMKHYKMIKTGGKIRARRKHIKKVSNKIFKSILKVYLEKFVELETAEPTF